jgi:ligand-binding SRPBCC domain-containing protein
VKFVVQSKIRDVNIQDVYSVFDFRLLAELSPPIMKPEAKLYEGNELGDQLYFVIRTPIGDYPWKGKVTEESITENEIYFVDEGIQMAFGMSAWKHKHRLIKTDYGTLIRDEVFFDTKNVLLKYVLLPGVWMQFLYRKPLYEKIVKKRLGQNK